MGGAPPLGRRCRSPRAADRRRGQRGVAGPCRRAGRRRSTRHEERRRPRVGNRAPPLPRPLRSDRADAYPDSGRPAVRRRPGGDDLGGGRTTGDRGRLATGWPQPSGRVHRLTADWPQRPGWRSSTDLLVADAGTKIDLGAMPAEGVARCRAAWARLAGREACVVHGDPNAGNVRMTADRDGTEPHNDRFLGVAGLGTPPAPRSLPTRPLVSVARLPQGRSSLPRPARRRFPRRRPGSRPAPAPAAQQSGSPTTSRRR